MTNTLAYYDRVLINADKSFISYAQIVVVLSVVMLSVVMLSVVMLSVVMLNVRIT